MPLLSRCCFVRHRVTSSCKSAILDRWMRAFVDRSPLDYILGQMRSAAGRAGASKTATLAFGLACCSWNAASGARAVAWCLFLGRNFAYCSGFLSFFQQSLCDGASAVCPLRSSRSSPRECVAITFAAFAMSAAVAVCVVVSSVIRFQETGFESTIRVFSHWLY